MTRAVRTTKASRKHPSHSVHAEATMPTGMEDKLNRDTNHLGSFLDGKLPKKCSHEFEMSVGSDGNRVDGVDGRVPVGAWADEQKIPNSEVNAETGTEADEQQRSMSAWDPDDCMQPCR